MIVKIEKGVPLDSAPYIRWPWRQLNVGDSFFTEVEQRRVASSASHFSRTNPSFKFAVRKVKEDGRNGCRVWRTR